MAKLIVVDPVNNRERTVTVPDTATAGQIQRFKEIELAKMKAEREGGRLGLMEGPAAIASGLTRHVTHDIPQFAATVEPYLASPLPGRQIPTEEEAAATQDTLAAERGMVEDFLLPEDDRFLEKTARFVGPVAPLGIAARAGQTILRNAPRVVGSVAKRNVRRQALNRARRETVAETAAGAGGVLGEEYGGDVAASIGGEEARPIGQIAGAVVGSGTPGAAGRGVKRGVQTVGGRDVPLNPLATREGRVFSPMRTRRRPASEGVSPGEAVGARDFLAGGAADTPGGGTLRLRPEAQVDYPLSVGITGNRNFSALGEQTAASVPITGIGVAGRMDTQNQRFGEGLDTLADVMRGGPQTSQIDTLGANVGTAAEGAARRVNRRLDQGMEDIITGVGGPQTVIPTYGVDEDIATRINPAIRGNRGVAQTRRYQREARRFRNPETSPSAGPIDPNIDRQLRQARDAEIQTINRVENIDPQKRTAQDVADLQAAQQNLEAINEQIDINTGNTAEAVLAQRSEIGRESVTRPGMDRNVAARAQEAYRVRVKEALDSGPGTLTGDDLERIFDDYSNAQSSKFRMDRQGTLYGEVPELQRVIQMNPEAAAQWLTNSGKPVAARLRLLQKNTSPRQWNQLRGDLFESLFTTKPGQVDAGPAVSSNTFLTNWGNLPPRTKQLFFEPDEQDLFAAANAYEDLARNIRSRGKEYNISRSGAHSILYNWFRNLRPTFVAAETGAAAGLSGMFGTAAGPAALAASALVTGKMTGREMARLLAEQPETFQRALMLTMRARMQGSLGSYAAASGRASEPEDMTIPVP